MGAIQISVGYRSAVEWIDTELGSGLPKFREKMGASAILGWAMGLACRANLPLQEQRSKSAVGRGVIEYSMSDWRAEDRHWPLDMAVLRPVFVPHPLSKELAVGNKKWFNLACPSPFGSVLIEGLFVIRRERVAP